MLITRHVAIEGPYLNERRCEVLAEKVSRFLAEPLCRVVDKQLW